MAHVVRVEGRLAMRALFFRADAAVLGEGEAQVLAVPPLLRELILAACAEPLEWDEGGRGGHLAALIAEEVARAPRLAFALPAPRDARLKRLADALQADPAADLTLGMGAALRGERAHPGAAVPRRDRHGLRALAAAAAIDGGRGQAGARRDSGRGGRGRGLCQRIRLRGGVPRRLRGHAR
jgi:hypothetical protein